MKDENKQEVRLLDQYIREFSDRGFEVASEQSLGDTRPDFVLAKGDKVYVLDTEYGSGTLTISDVTQLSRQRHEAMKHYGVGARIMAILSTTKTIPTDVLQLAAELDLK